MLKNRIAVLREGRGWKQSELAKRLKVSTRSVINWENGISDPSACNIIALATLFHVSTDYVLGYQPATYISLDGLAKLDRRRLFTIYQSYISIAANNDKINS